MGCCVCERLLVMGVNEVVRGEYMEGVDVCRELMDHCGGRRLGVWRFVWYELSIDWS